MVPYFINRVGLLTEGPGYSPSSVCTNGVLAEPRGPVNGTRPIPPRKSHKMSKKLGLRAFVIDNEAGVRVSRSVALVFVEMSKLIPLFLIRRRPS